MLLCVRRRCASPAAPDEILRNIIAERVLGLPGDIRVDKDRAVQQDPDQGAMTMAMRKAPTCAHATRGSHRRAWQIT